MKLQSVWAFAFALMLVVASSACAQQSAGVLLQSGLYKEEVNGELETAIEIYERVLKEFPKDRPIAAKALLHIGLCYEKLGKQEAQKAYQRLIKEFADQNDMVVKARKRLAGMQGDNGKPGATVRKIWGAHGSEKEIKDQDVILYSLTWGGDSRVSPHGRYIAYTNWGPPSIAVYDLTTGESRDITDEGTWEDLPTGDEHGEYPIWSRDGSRVAYTWVIAGATVDGLKDHSQLRIVGLAGGKPRIIYRTDSKQEYIKPYDWSADGKTILATIEYGRERSPSHIVLISTEDGSKRILKSFEQDLFNDNVENDQMFFSPDGRYIAFDLNQSSDHPKRDIFLLRTDGSADSIPLVTHPADDQLLGWTPDGKSILFATNRTGVKNMAIMKVREGRPQGVPQLVRRLDAGFQPIGLIQNGTYYYSVRIDTSDVYTSALDLETGKVAAEPVLVNAPMEGFASTPCWSSDGRHLAYLSKNISDSVVPTHWSIYNAVTIRSLESRRVREVRHSDKIRGISFHTLRWSPDGKSLLFHGVAHHALKGGSRGGLFKMDAQTGQVSLITHPTGVNELCMGPKWSLDGQSIFYQRGPRRGDGETLNSARILKRNLITGKEREIAGGVTFGPAPFYFFPDFFLSPNGRKVAFIAVEEAENEKPFCLLKIKPLAGGKATELFRTRPGGFILHGWTPDGRYILLQDVKSWDRENIWQIPVMGGEPRKIELNMKEIHHLRVHPDGRQVAFDVKRRKLELWVMEDFLPKPTAGK